MSACASWTGLRVLGIELRPSSLLVAAEARGRLTSLGNTGTCCVATLNTEVKSSRRHPRPVVDYAARCCTVSTRSDKWKERPSKQAPSWYLSATRQEATPWRSRPLVRSKARPRTAARFFSSALRCLREEDKPAEARSSRSSPSAPKTPLSSILGPTAHENIYNIPNFLTFTRLLAGPGLAYLIVNSSHVAALGLFVYAGITDALDGYLARRWKQTSVVGSVVDPMADKTLMTAATLALAAQARLPWPLAVIILGRDVLLAISAIYYRWISLPPPKTMARYWDFSLPSAEVHPTGISKVNTVLQLVLIGATVAMPLVPESIVAAWRLGEGLVGLQWIVGFTTVWSGLSYVGSKDAVRILGKDAKKGKGA